MTTIELSDIQGIVLRGYGVFPVSRFVLLRVTDAELARGWLGSIASSVFSSADVNYLTDETAPDSVLNIAFTCEGFRAFGLHETTLSGFSHEFREGMVTPHRQRLLGDFGQSDPRHWRWGGPNNAPIHAMLLLYARDESKMEAAWERYREQFPSAGVDFVGRLEGTTLQGRKEHFGFRDGIGQPFVKGVDDGGPESNRIALGEFVLGYKNEYDLIPDSPRIVEPQGKPELLGVNPETGTGKDFGRNGSYLVFRQMSQDVHGFWDFIHGKTGTGTAAVKLASQMVGRWPSGAPITRFPNTDPGGLSDDDDFGYRSEDPNGEKCPIGSHVRRTNPRDGLLDSNSEQSTRIANHHRIIRRGRAYGASAVESMNPDQLLETPNPTDEVGLHFMCFNANIANQFQFIQFNWAGSAKFERFYNDPDPLISVQVTGPGGSPPVFTIPESPVRKEISGLKRFVEVRGGAYFFMPGKRAIQFLASIERSGSSVPET
jgi:Dyp-type peroxidase family